MNILWDGIVINTTKTTIDNFTCEGNRQITLYKFHSSRYHVIYNNFIILVYFNYKAFIVLIFPLGWLKKALQL